MKIAFTSRGRSLDVLLDGRFGRTPFFVVHDTVSGETAAVENVQNLNAAQGAGIQAAVTVANAGALERHMRIDSGSSSPNTT